MERGFLMKYLSIIKPGIIFGNIVTLCGGYFLAAHIYGFAFFSFLSSLLGMTGIIACGCVLNNCFDRDIDRLMDRTKNRLLACDKLPIKITLGYAILLGLLGFIILYVGTNGLTTLVALAGLITYAGAYTLWFKRSSVFGTIIGAISGAVPPVIGYTALANRLDLVALVLFLILFCWQMPHFFAIAICYKDDYAKASIPVLPLKRSLRYTKFNMLIFTVLFVIATLLLPLLGVTNGIYLIGAILLGVAGIALSIWGFFATHEAVWARKMFAFSILNITLLSILMAI